MLGLAGAVSVAAGAAVLAHGKLGGLIVMVVPPLQTTS
jgi:hypothetical protein